MSISLAIISANDKFSTSPELRAKRSAGTILAVVLSVAHAVLAIIHLDVCISALELIIIKVRMIRRKKTCVIIMVEAMSELHGRAGI